MHKDLNKIKKCRKQFEFEWILSNVFLLKNLQFCAVYELIFYSVRKIFIVYLKRKRNDSRVTGGLKFFYYSYIHELYSQGWYKNFVQKESKLFKATFWRKFLTMLKNSMVIFHSLILKYIYTPSLPYYESGSFMYVSAKNEKRHIFKVSRSKLGHSNAENRLR